MRWLERICIFVLAATYILMMPVRLLAAQGVHIVTIKADSPDTFFIKEFIDNSLIPEIINGDNNNVSLIFPSVRVVSDFESDRISILKAKSESLVVFSAQNLAPMESRIERWTEIYQELILKRELVKQIIFSTLQVPFWPFWATTEVPIRGIDIERELRLPYEDTEIFSAAAFAGSGEISNWQVVDFGKRSVEIRNSGESGEGRGIFIEYIIKGNVSDLRIDIPDNPSIAALYVSDDVIFQLSGAPFIRSSIENVLGLAGQQKANLEKVPFSVTPISDDEGRLVRYIACPSAVIYPSDIFWEVPVGPEGIEKESAQIMPKIPENPQMVSLMVISGCWFVFGILILLGNLLFSFSSERNSIILGRSVILYPLYVIISLLTSGSWGLGFIPAAAFGARFLASKGNRLKAFMVILAASFLIAFISIQYSFF